MKRCSEFLKKHSTSVLLLAFALIGLIALIVGSASDLEAAKRAYAPALASAGRVAYIVAALPAFVLFGSSYTLLATGDKKDASGKRVLLSQIMTIVLPIFSGLLYGYLIIHAIFSSLILSLLIGVAIVALFASLVSFFQKRCALWQSKTAASTLVSFFLVVVVLTVINALTVRPSYASLIANSEDPSSFYFDWWGLKGNSDPSLSSFGDIPLDPGGPSLVAALSPFAFFLYVFFPEKYAKKTWVWGVIAGIAIILAGFAELSMGHRFLSSIAWGLLIGSLTLCSFFALIAVPSLEREAPIKKTKPHLPKDNPGACHKTLRQNRYISIKAKRSRRAKRNRAQGRLIVASIDGTNDPKGRER